MFGNETKELCTKIMENSDCSDAFKAVEDMTDSTLRMVVRIYFKEHEAGLIDWVEVRKYLESRKFAA